MFFQNFLKFPMDLPAVELPARAAQPQQDRATTYRSLLGERAWMRLDPAIRDRFACRARDRAFYGAMGRVELSAAGRVLALLSRLFGSSLFPRTGRDIVTLIDVEGAADDASGIWKRAYLMPGGRRFTVTSVKRFDADEGLLECLGRGFVMKLALHARPDALHFVSTGYQWRCGPVRINLPDVISPGATHVIHRELSGGRFRFTLCVDHPLFGRLVFQEGDFFEKENTP